jgi:small subunit ribosomal protein S5
MGLIDKEPAARELFKPYSEKEKALLAKKYTREQIRAIEAGEEAIRPEDLKRQGVVRTDIGSISYLDDFRHYRNVIDKKPPDNAPIDPNARFMTYDELTQSFIDYHKKLEKENPPPAPDDPEGKFDSTRLNFMRADYESPRYMGTHGPIPSGPNLFAPAIPKKLELDGRPKTTEDGQVEEVSREAKADPRDPEGVYNLVIRQTGLTMDEIMNLKVKVLVRNFVANQTRLGKVRSLFCIAIAGNKNGQLGIGQAKGQETLNTMNLAKISAIRNMKPIPRYEERTIFGDVEAKVSGTIVKLMARPPGKSNLTANY